MNKSDDTITAIATPIGEGGISVIRLSGKNSIGITEKYFKGKEKLSDSPTHAAHYGTFLDENRNIIDEVVVTIFRVPHSYTGEDVAEISCHGGILVTKKILETTINAGARMAEPGEFTKRAFLNGKLDLMQAEAVADLIASRSELSLKSSLAQLQGTLSEKMYRIRKELIDIAGSLELEIDFSEEDIEITSRKQIIGNIDELIKYVMQLIDSFELGKIYREGVRVVLAGRPNVGKSSLMNAFLQEDRVIVTHISGTTRDIIEENIEIEGVLFTIIDTAGLRNTHDFIEKEGIRRTKKQIEEADVIAFIVEANNISADDVEFFNKIFFKNKRGKKIVIVVNKIDLLSGTGKPKVPHALTNYTKFFISAKEGNGINELRTGLKDVALTQLANLPEDSLIITNVRHKKLLELANTSLKTALQALKNGASNELIIIDLNEAIRAIGEITGEITSQEILDNIFNHFCIGK